MNSKLRNLTQNPPPLLIFDQRDSFLDKKINKSEILKKIKATRQGKEVFRAIIDMPFEQIKDIYEARLRFLNTSEEDFNRWLRKKSFYAEGLSLSVIAFIMNLTKERVRQIETMCFKKLKRPSAGGKLKKYVTLYVNTNVCDMR